MESGVTVTTHEPIDGMYQTFRLAPVDDVSPTNQTSAPRATGDGRTHRVESGRTNTSYPGPMYPPYTDSLVLNPTPTESGVVFVTRNDSVFVVMLTSL